MIDDRTLAVRTVKFRFPCSNLRRRTCSSSVSRSSASFPLPAGRAKFTMTCTGQHRTKRERAGMHRIKHNLSSVRERSKRSAGNNRIGLLRPLYARLRTEVVPAPSRSRPRDRRPRVLSESPRAHLGHEKMHFRSSEEEKPAKIL